MILELAVLLTGVAADAYRRAVEKDDTDDSTPSTSATREVDTYGYYSDRTAESSDFIDSKY